MKETPVYSGEVLLMRFLDFAYCNKDVNTNHIALYAHALTTYDRLGKPEWFQIHKQRAIERAHISRHPGDFYRFLADLVEWGWLRRSKRIRRNEAHYYGLTDGVKTDAYENALAYGKPECDPSRDDIVAETAEIKPEIPDDVKVDTQDEVGLETPDEVKLERFGRIFDPWSVNVVKNDRIWARTVKGETGIVDFPLAMRLFKEHIIRNSKTTEWLGMSLDEKKRYFLYASKRFLTSECKRVKDVVATVRNEGGKQYVTQYGVTFMLPDNCPPQPDVDYHWDTRWNGWRKGG